MDIGIPFQIETLIAFGAFTAAVIAAFVWYLLKSNGFSNLKLDRINGIVFLLLCLIIAAIMSSLLFFAMASGVTFNVGKYGRHRIYISQDPAGYWFSVVFYYGAAIAALSFGLGVAVKLIQPRRSLPGAHHEKKVSERISKSAGSSHDDAPDPESELSDSPEKPLTGPWRTATIVYVTAMVFTLFLYTQGDWGWHMPLLLPFAAFAPGLISFGLMFIYTGEFPLRRSGVFHRSKNPIGYWACVGATLSIGIALLLAGIAVIGT